jgi:hypothetical protein
MAPPCICSDLYRIGLAKGWVNSFLAFLGQLYIGFNNGSAVGSRGSLQKQAWLAKTGVEDGKEVRRREDGGKAMQGHLVEGLFRQAEEPGEKGRVGL